VEARIAEWHARPPTDEIGETLHGFLGWTWQEYAAYVERGVLPEQDPND
jgi:hypothetical protein